MDYLAVFLFVYFLALWMISRKDITISFYNELPRVLFGGWKYRLVLAATSCFLYAMLVRAN